MQLVNLDEYRSRGVVNALKQLLGAAERGQIRGLAFVVKVAHGDNRAGLAGSYKRNPEAALRAAFMLERHLSGWDSEFADSGT